MEAVQNPTFKIEINPSSGGADRNYQLLLQAKRQEKLACIVLQQEL